MTDRCEDHVRQAHVARKGIAAIDLGRQIEPRKSGTGAVGLIDCPLGYRGRAQHGRIGRIERDRFIDQFGKAGLLLAVGDEAGLGLAFFPGNVPAFGGGHRQHGAGRSGGSASGSFVGGQAGALCRHHEGLALTKALGQSAVGPGGEIGRKRHPQAAPVRRQRRIGIGPADRGRLDRDLSPVRAEFRRNNLR